MNVDMGQSWVLVAMLILPSFFAALAIIFGVWSMRKFNMYVQLMRERASVIEQKLDVVHEATNSRLHGIEEELRETKEELETAVSNIAHRAGLDRAAQDPRRQPE